MQLNKEIIAFHIIEVLFLIGLSSLSLIILPGGTIPIIVTILVCYVLVQSFYSYSTICTHSGRWTIFIVGALLGVGLVLNTWYFTTFAGGSLENPVLQNDDSHRLYNCALSIYNTMHPTTEIPYYGYPYLVAMLWKITGVTILVPLLVNYVATLVSVVATAFMTTRLLSTKVSHSLLRWGGNVAMILTGLCCYYLGCGVVVLKEPSLYLGVVLVLYVLAGFANSREDGNIILDLVMFLIGGALIAANRAGFMYIILISLLTFINRYSWRKIAILCTMSVALLLGAYAMHHYNATRDIKMIYGTEQIESRFMRDSKNGSHAVYNEQFKNYFYYPVWEKVLLLPVTMGVQYFVPFAWNYTNSEEFGPTQMYSHFGFPWYCVGGIMLFFFLYAWRYTPRVSMWRWGALCVLSFATVAFISVGVVSRYYLPFIPAYAALATYVLIKLRERQGVGPFMIWSGVYTLMVVAVLLICYHITR